MKKQICYVLMISKYFPAYHPKAGQQTNFEYRILGLTKLHTIRANYELWRKRFEKIDKGEAYLSVRQWKGKPRRIKQEEIFRFDKSDDIGIQKMQKINDIWCIDGSLKSKLTTTNIARNDGLSFPDFVNWFGTCSLDKPLAIIHFTEFRY